MNRCSVCDYSQSADSLYFDGIATHHQSTNNRVIYSPSLGKDICLHCLDDYHSQNTFWTILDGDDDVPIAEDADETDYPGCTEKPSD